jgi:hypothetical protein
MTSPIFSHFCFSPDWDHHDNCIVQIFAHWRQINCLPKRRAKKCIVRHYAQAGCRPTTSYDNKDYKNEGRFVVECISLFSGAGGLDVGAKMAGVSIVRAVEFDRDAAETLKLNSDSSVLIDCIDVCEIDFRDHQGGTADKIVIGGPPCQPFSKNGYWVKNENRLIDKYPRNMNKNFATFLLETTTSH